MIGTLPPAEEAGPDGVSEHYIRLFAKGEPGAEVEKADFSIYIAFPVGGLGYLQDHRDNTVP